MGAARAEPGGHNTLPRTRSQLEERVRSANNPLEVKAELMDGTNDEYNYTEEEVFVVNSPKNDNINVNHDSNKKWVQDASSVISSSMTSLNRAHMAVMAARKAASSMRQLNPGKHSTELVSTGSFVTKGDDRIGRTTVSHSLINRTSISRSFELSAGRCTSCLGGRHPAWVGAQWPSSPLTNHSRRAFPSWWARGSACAWSGWRGAH